VWGGLLIKQLANLITSTRFLLAAGMVLTAPFSAAFWACYLGGGVSDLLDGPIARRLNIQSTAGAKLDSAADLAFAAAISVAAVRSVPLPIWIWVCAACITAVRLAGHSIGFAKYRTFSALHTYANKATGALIFASPLLYAALGLTGSGIVLCAAALFSSVEELVITVSAPTLNRDCKGIYQMKHHGEARI
jgi:CDP-diacylglycerol--glycerol-3-phosphate 3-phosphatidyltransferase